VFGGYRTLGRTETPADVVARADAALYRAKAAGRDCVVVAPQTTAIATWQPSVPSR
jgi:predicted signal transduction protein with EAL and GGDEF domain